MTAPRNLPNDQRISRPSERGRPQRPIAFHRSRNLSSQTRAVAPASPNLASLTRLRFESIQDASGGAVVNLVFDDSGDISPGQIEELRTAIQSEAEQKAQFLREALAGEKQTVLLLKGEVQALERTVDKLLLNQKPNIYLSEGDLNMSSDTYNISGQVGAVGPNAHAHDITFNQIGSRIEQSMDCEPSVSRFDIL